MHPLALLAALVLGLCSRVAQSSPVEWTGDIHLPGGTKLGVTFTLTPATPTDPARAEISIPAQKVDHVALSDVSILDDHSFKGTFKPAGVGENMWCVFDCRSFHGSNAAVGHMKQVGQLFAVTLDSSIKGEPRAPNKITASESWRGAIHLPGGQTLHFTAEFKAGDSVTATMSIPSQGLTAGELHDVTANHATMTFTLKPAGAPERAWAKFFAVRSPDGATAMGTMDQMGSKFAVVMERIVEGKESTITPKRPQLPKPPFPYISRDVEFVNDISTFKLAGTLTIPPNAGPHPAAILITGSGQQDRDETLFDHKLFMVIADHLTRQGIAVLRLDDRGVGGSTGDPTTCTTQDFATDIAAALAFLKKEPEIDPLRIGLIGHSEGGVIAPLVAVTHPQDVRYIVMLAGTGVSGREISIRQGELMSRAAGMPEAAIEQQKTLLPKILDLIEADASDTDIAAAIRAMGVEQARAAGMDPESAEGKAAIDTVVQQQTGMLASKWMRWFIRYDPRPTLKLVACPVLALNGSLDTQVPADINLPEIEKALKEGGNTDVTVVTLPGLNHLFQTAKSGALDEYARIEETFAPVALDAMTRWIRRRMGLGD